MNRRNVCIREICVQNMFAKKNGITYSAMFKYFFRNKNWTEQHEKDMG